MACDDTNSFHYIGIAFVVVFVGKALYNFLNGCRIHLWSKISKIDIGKHYGKWGAITGCTEGIGRAFARELASRGVNMVLISHLPEDLKIVAADIERDFKVKTKVVVADLSKGQEVYDYIAKEIADIEVGLLINNVGVGPPYPMLLEEISAGLTWAHITINMASATMMTRMLLPGMKARGRGLIVNMSSQSSTMPLARMVPYGASKSYLAYFGRAVNIECEGTGVTVQTLTPNFIRTKLASFSPILMKHAGFYVPAPETFVKHAVDTFGRSTDTTGYAPHGFFLHLFDLIPLWLKTKVTVACGNFFRQQYDSACARRKERKEDAKTR